MKSTLRSAFAFLLLLLAGCDNVGRAFDPDVEPNEPDPGTAESIVEDVPVGGIVRSGRPRVRAAYPEGAGWPLAVPVVLEFSESVNQSSIRPTTPQANDARIVLRARGTTQVLPCTYDFLAAGRLLVMRPIAALTNTQSPTYEVVMLPDARDCDGVRFEVPEGGLVLTEFQVNQDEALTDGRILALFPRDNARDATREDEVVVVFDRPAVPASVTPANLLVRPTGGAAVAGALDLPLETVGVDDGRVARFIAATPFAGSVQYELVVTDAIAFAGDGRLDFRGRTPFARFETVAPQAPLGIALAAPTPDFPDQINAARVATAALDVDVPADAAEGDKVRARIYGLDASTAGTGDRTFVEGSTTLAVGGAQTVTVDFAGALGSVEDPELDDGPLTFAAQLQRGSATSGFVHQPDNAAPAFDVTPPTLQRAGPPGSTDGRDVWTDLEGLAFYGIASERLHDARLVVGANPEVAMFASDDAGRFVMAGTGLGRLTAPVAYSLTITDAAGNPGAAAASGFVVQRGVVTGALGATVTVEAYDEATLAPIAGATVLVDPGVPAANGAGQQIATTGAVGRATVPAAAASHTITIVRAGYDLVTLYTTTAGFASLPLRPLTGATATFTGRVEFTTSNGVTAIVGNTAVATPGILGLRTTNAAPTTIPATPIVANRPQVVTAFAGAFEPTAQPTFTAHGCVQLGPTLTTKVPPGAPAAAGVESQVLLPLLPSTGQLLPSNAWPQDFATATGLDTSTLVGGVPRVRITAPLTGFGGQALLGIGFATTAGGSVFSAEGSFSLPILAGLAPYAGLQLLFTALEAQDGAGRVCRAYGLLPITGGAPQNIFFDPHPIPVISTPGAPGGSPAVTFVDGFHPEPGVNAFASFDVTATDANDRRWVLLVADRDPAGGNDVVQFPDLVANNVQGLAAGAWDVVVEGRCWTGVAGFASPDDCLLTERIRAEIGYSRGLPATFTVQ